jgi:copper chaperone CopZ
MLFMKVLSLELPAMYGDHHVVEVRRLLFEIPGVEDVYASSGFRAAEITYDPDKVDPEAIQAKLDDAGYLGETPIPVEVAAQSASTGNGKQGFFRHTTTFATTSHVVGFGQNVNYEGRPLWPCPGVQPLTGMDEE